jgi:hypothetical protein
MLTVLRGAIVFTINALQKRELLRYSRDRMTFSMDLVAKSPPASIMGLQSSVCSTHEIEDKSP